MSKELLEYTMSCADETIYERNLKDYIHSLKDTPIAFIYMTKYETQMKTSAKFIGNDYYITLTPPQYFCFYAYVYKASDVKYMVTEAESNVDSVRVVRLDRGDAETIDMDHPYLANHGYHLSFGIHPATPRSNFLKIDTHRTTYSYMTRRYMSFFYKDLNDERCTFKFDPLINKKYATFLGIPCLSTQCTIKNTYKSPDDLHVIHHLLNKMNQVDVPIRPKSSMVTGGGKQHVTYKGYDFMNDDFLAFLRLYLQKLTYPASFTCIYDPQYKNMILCIDFGHEEIERFILWIYMPKALKACYAYYHKDLATTREKLQLKTFSEAFESKIKKLAF